MFEGHCPYRASFHIQSLARYSISKKYMIRLSPFIYANSKHPRLRTCRQQVERSLTLDTFKNF